MNDYSFSCPEGFVEVSEFNELQPGKYLFFIINNGSRCPYIAKITDVGDVDGEHTITYSMVGGVGDDTIHTYNIDSWRAVMGRAFMRVNDD